MGADIVMESIALKTPRLTGSRNEVAFIASYFTARQLRIVCRDDLPHAIPL
jgi:hypothetical protein